MGLTNTADDIEVGNEIALRITAEDTKEEKANQGGQTRVADAILAAARRNNVQIRKDPAMIETLAQYNVSESIPPELYSAVSEILTFLQRLEVSIK